MLQLSGYIHYIALYLFDFKLWMLIVKTCIQNYYKLNEYEFHATIKPPLILL